MKLSEYKKLEADIEKKFGYKIDFMDAVFYVHEKRENRTVRSFFIELVSNYNMEIFFKLSDDLECYEGSRTHSTIMLKDTNSLKDLDKLIKDLELVKEISDYVIEKCPFPIRV